MKKKSLWIAVCIVIAIVLVSALFYFVMGRKPSATPTGPMIAKQAINGGFRFVFPGYDQPPKWGDIAIQLWDDKGHTISWGNLTTVDLTGTTKNVTWHFGSPQGLGELNVWLNVTDRTGDGRLDAGDYLDFTTSGARFSNTATYTFVLLYKPTGGSMIACNFNG